MKNLSYSIIAIWISFAVSAYGTMYVMNKIRIADSTQSAAESIESLVRIGLLLEENGSSEVKKEVEFELYRLLRLAQGCDYDQCLSPIDKRVESAINAANNYLARDRMP